MQSVVTLYQVHAAGRRSFAGLVRQRFAGAMLCALCSGTLAACGAPAPGAAPGSTPAPLPTTVTTPAAPSPTGAPTAQVAGVTAPGGAVSFQIKPGESTATFRVREQLARLPAPSDAVGSTDAVTGQIVLQPDGTIVASDSKIAVDLNTLKTDQAQRDNFIKRNTLQTNQFPKAEFVPSDAEGLPSPLPAAGQHTFQLTGPMTIRGVQKEVTWDVTAAREGANLTGTATTAFKFGDFGMQPPQVAVVLSVADDIRLEVNLVASQVS